MFRRRTNPRGWACFLTPSPRSHDNTTGGISSLSEGLRGIASSTRILFCSVGTTRQPSLYASSAALSASSTSFPGIDPLPCSGRRSELVIKGLYDAVLGAELDTSSSGVVHKLTLTDGFCWLTDREELGTTYIRPEVHTALWNALKDQFHANGHLLIIGNPGFGKSWSLNYLLYQSLKTNLAEVVVLRSRLGWYVFDTNTKVATLFPTEQRFPEEVIHQRLNSIGSRYLLLHDVGTDDGDVKLDLCENVFRRASTVLASSPKLKNYQHFEKHFRPCRSFTFPPLTREEFLEVTNETSLPADERRLKFDRYGSSIRNADSDMEVLEHNLVVGIWAFKFTRPASGQITDDASSTVLQLVPTKDGKNVRYNQQRVEFVSKYAEKKFWVSRFDEAFPALTSDAWLGKWLSIEHLGGFQWYVQKFADRLNWQSPLINLQSQDSQGSKDLSLQPSKVKRVPPCRPEDIHTILDSFQSSDSFRWLAPSIGTFPVMDAFLVHNDSLYGVRITVSDADSPTESNLVDLESHGFFLSDTRMQRSNVRKKRRLDGVIFIVDKYRSLFGTPQLVTKAEIGTILGPEAVAWNSLADKQFTLLVDLKEHSRLKSSG